MAYLFKIHTRYKFGSRTYITIIIISKGNPRTLMDGIIEIRPTNFDFSQILIVMLNWLIPK